MVLVIMGVSGSGKSTIGRLLAKKMHLPFYDADEFHPPDSVKKMSSRIPLNDEDRQPWLEVLSNKIREWNRAGGAVVACSALKKKYRSALQSKSNEVQFIYLKGSKGLIEERLKNREGHYMPSELLESQFNALEEPEEAVVVSVAQKPAQIVGQVFSALKV